MTLRRAFRGPSWLPPCLGALIVLTFGIALGAQPAGAQHPHVTVSMSASPTEIAPAGDVVTYTVRVANTIYTDTGGLDPLTLDSLIDDVEGDLNGRGTCVLPQAIAFVGDTAYTCSYPATVGGEPETSRESTVTATGFFASEPSSVLGSARAFVNLSSAADGSSPHFSISHRTVTEPDSGHTLLDVLVSRAPGARGGVVVYTSDGTATHGVDYVGYPTGYTVGFGPGEHASFTVPIVGDVDVEGDETFTLLGVYQGDGDIVGGTTSAAQVTIVDNDIDGSPADWVDDARLIGHTLPSDMSCGEVRTASVTLENTGTSTWTEEHRFRLGAIDGSDPFAERRISLPTGLTVAPGQTHTFDLELTAPDGATEVLTEWRMEHDGMGAFGDIAGAIVTVSCSDFGVRVIDPRPEPVADGGIFDLGAISSHHTGGDFEFVILPPTGNGHGVSNLRVESLVGPLTLDLDQLVGEESVLPDGVTLTGSFRPNPETAPAAPGSVSPFEARLAFDTSSGDTYTFTIVGTYEQAISCSVGSELAVSGSVFPPAPIAADELPFELPIDLTLRNTHSSCAIEIQPGDVDHSTRILPLGYSFRSDAFDATVSIPPGESWDFTVFITAGPFAEAATVTGAISVLPSNSGFQDFYDFSVHFDILGPTVSLDNVSVQLGEGGPQVGDFGLLTLPTPVQGTRDVFFFVHNDNDVPIRIDGVESEIRGEAAAALRWTVDPSFTSITERGLGSFGGTLEVLDPGEAGDFTLEISFTVTDDGSGGDFSGFFRATIEGTLVSCSPNCGPLATIFDSRGFGVAGRHSRRLQSGEATQLLEFRVGNIGDQDLVLTGQFTLAGDARFSRQTLPSGDRPIAPGTTFEHGERFVIGFDTDGASPDEVYEATVTVHGNGANQPFSFDLAVEPEPPFPLDIEIVDHSIVDGVAELGRHDHLPLEPTLRFTNNSGRRVRLTAVTILKSRGGPLEWAWHPSFGPPPGHDAGSIVLDRDKSAPYQGLIQHNGLAGDINQPFTFDVMVQANEKSSTDGRELETQTKVFSVTGNLIAINNQATGLPIIDCIGGHATDDPCTALYCDKFLEIAGSNSLQPICLAGLQTVVPTCRACPKAGPARRPCWIACAVAFGGTLACAQTGFGVVGDLEDAYDRMLDCSCQRDREFCDQEFFLGYDVAGLPLGKWTDIEVSCSTVAPEPGTNPPIDGVRTFGETIRVTQVDQVNYSALRCPEKARWVLEASPVRDDDPADPEAFVDRYRCRLAHPTGARGEQPDIPLALGTMLEHTMVEIDCHCVGADCGEQITLRGTAVGLDAQTGPVEVGVHLQGLSIDPIVVGVATEDGTFTFERTVPPVDGYTVSILNRDDAPHCMVDSTRAEVAEGITSANVVTLTCDRSVPNVRIITPSDGDEVYPDPVTQTVTIRAVAGDEHGVQRVLFYADGVAVGSKLTHPYEIEWVPSGSGIRTLTALVQANDSGDAWSEEVDVTVVGGVLCDLDADPPTVFSTPRAGQFVPRRLPGIVLTADAADDTATVRVDFFLDGQQITRFGPGPVYTVQLPPQLSTLGEHTLRLEVFDACGKVTEIPEFTFTITDTLGDLAGGWLNPAQCDHLTGVANDPDHADPLLVEFFRGGPRGTGVHVGSAITDHSPCESLGCFSIPTPVALKTGFQETVYVHVQDVDDIGLPTGQWPSLLVSPQTLECPDAGGGPPTPAGVRVEENGSFTALNLFWEPSDGAVNYLVYRNTFNHDASATKLPGSVQATSFADTTAEVGTTYYYWVRARNPDGTSDFSQSASGSIRPLVDEHALEGTLDGAVCGLINGWARDGDWTGATQFSLYTNGPPGIGTLLSSGFAHLLRQDLPFADQEHGFRFLPTFDTIPHGTAIHAVAEGRDSHGRVTGSFELVNSPLAFDCPGSKALTIPTGVAASDGVVGRVTVTWNPVPHSEDVTVWRHTEDHRAAASPLATGVVTTSFEDTTASPDTTYFYWIEAHKAGQASTWSVSDSGWMASPVPVPIGVTASDGLYADHVRIHWTAVAGVDHYEVWRSTGTEPHGATRLVGDVTGTAHDDTSAVVGTPYTYWLKASDGLNVSDWSAGDIGTRGPIDLHAPDGNFATADCTSLIGWARDADAKDALTVEIYQGGPRDSGTLVTRLVASNLNTGLPFADRSHGFHVALSDAPIADGTMLYAYALAIDSLGGETGLHVQLPGSPRSMDCPSAARPAAPSDVAASDGTDLDKVRISWSAADRAVHYSVWRGTGTTPHEATRIANYLQGTVYDDTTVGAGTSVQYWVKAHNAYGASPFSGGDLGLRGPVDHHLPDGNFRTADCSSLVGWARDADSAEPLRVAIYRDGPLGSGTLVTSVIASNLNVGLPFADQHHGFRWTVPADTIADGTPLYAYAIGVDSAGLSTGQRTQIAGSPRTMACPTATPSAAPTGVVATDGEHIDKVRITWNAADRAGHYSVWRGTASTPHQATRIANYIEGTTYDDTTTFQGTRYTYWVKAHNAFGASPFSPGDGGARGPVDLHDPDGNFRTADCSGLVGWARDEDSTAPLRVAIYRDGPLGSGTLVASVIADELSTGLPFADQHHAFRWTVPDGLLADGTSLYAYALDVDSQGVTTGQRTLIPGSPRSLDCPVDP